MLFSNDDDDDHDHHHHHCFSKPGASLMEVHSKLSNTHNLWFEIKDLKNG